MSNVAELAELEAAIAEAELTDEEAQAVRAIVGGDVSISEAVESALTMREQPPEPPPPPPEPEPETGEPTAKQFRALDSEQRRHEARVHEIMGAHVAGFEVCEECSGVGIKPPGPSVQAHENFIACETCAGYGVVETGSLRPENEHRDCPACNGRGYLELLDEHGSPVADAPALAAQTNGGAVPLTPAPDAQPPPAGASAARYGVPAWMGDPNLGNG